MAIERHHRDPELELGGGIGKRGDRLESEAAGMVVRPHRVVAELGAARGQRPRYLRIQPRRDPEAPLPAHFSSTATHSTCGVCGNMSTGFTRRRV